MVRKCADEIRRGTRCAGFTLIEILCVVVILGIAAAVLMPQFGSRDDLNAAAATRVVMADLLYAQNRAISTQQPQYVAFDVSGQSYAIYSSMASPLTPITHPVTGEPYVVHFGASGAGSLINCSLTSANFGGQTTTIMFDETGTPWPLNSSTQLTGTGQIVITSGTYSLTIRVAQDTGELTCQ